MDIHDPVCRMEVGRGPPVSECATIPHVHAIDDASKQARQGKVRFHPATGRRTNNTGKAEPARRLHARASRLCGIAFQSTAPGGLVNGIANFRVRLFLCLPPKKLEFAAPSFRNARQLILRRNTSKDIRKHCLVICVLHDRIISASPGFLGLRKRAQGKGKSRRCDAVAYGTCSAPVVYPWPSFHIPRAHSTTTSVSRRQMRMLQSCWSQSSFALNPDNTSPQHIRTGGLVICVVHHTMQVIQSNQSVAAESSREWVQSYSHHGPQTQDTLFLLPFLGTAVTRRWAAVVPLASSREGPCWRFDPFCGPQTQGQRHSEILACFFQIF